MTNVENLLLETINYIKNSDIKFEPDGTKINEIEKLQNGKNYIYIINGELLNKETLIKEYENLKNKKIKIAKLNNLDNYSCIYLGSSQNIKKRLKEHLEKCSDSTYSLHFDKIRKNFKNVSIELYKFEEEIELVKCVEIMLSKKLSPLFGQSCIR